MRRRKLRQAVRRQRTFKVGLGRKILVQAGKEVAEGALSISTDKRIGQNIAQIGDFSPQQIKKLRQAAKEQARDSERKRTVTGLREWMMVDLLTSTGIKASEAANLRCSDVETGDPVSKIFIRNRKGRISGYVVMSDPVRDHLKSFLEWKERKGEGTGPDDHLFIGQRGPWTSQAIQQIVKKYLKKLGFYEPGKSVRALRRSYASELFTKVKEMRVVQKQLHHMPVPSASVRPEFMDETLKKKIKGLWR